MGQNLSSGKHHLSKKVTILSMDKKNGWILPGQIASVGISMQKGMDSVDGQPLCRCRPRVTRLDGSTVFLDSEGMLRVVVSFPSGSGQTLSLPELSKVGDLKILAQRSLGQGFLKLVTLEGHVLTNPQESLQDAGVQDGEAPNCCGTAGASSCN